MADETPYSARVVQNMPIGELLASVSMAVVSSSTAIANSNMDILKQCINKDGSAKMITESWKIIQEVDGEKYLSEVIDQVSMYDSLKLPLKRSSYRYTFDMEIGEVFSKSSSIGSETAVKASIGGGFAFFRAKFDMNAKITTRHDKSLSRSTKTSIHVEMNINDDMELEKYYFQEKQARIGKLLTTPMVRSMKRLKDSGVPTEPGETIDYIETAELVSPDIDNRE